MLCLALSLRVGPILLMVEVLVGLRWGDSPPHALVPPPGGANQQRRIPNTDPEAVMCKLVKESYAGLNSLILAFPLQQHSSS